MASGKPTPVVSCTAEACMPSSSRGDWTLFCSLYYDSVMVAVCQENTALHKYNVKQDF